MTRISSGQAILAITGFMLLTSSCDLSIFQPKLRNDAAGLAKSGVSTSQAVQTLYETLISERLDVEKAVAFHSVEVKTPCVIGPEPPAEPKVYDNQIEQLQNRVQMAKNMTALYQSFSSLAAFRSGDVRTKATDLATAFKSALPIPSSVATSMPAIIGGTADVLVALKQNSEIKDYAKALALAANTVDQIFESDKPALEALAAERRNKMTILSNQLMDCGLVTYHTVMADLASNTGITLIADDKGFSPFQKNIAAVAALTPAQHINDTSNALTADSSALTALIKAHVEFNASKPVSVAELEQLATKALTAAQKLDLSATKTLVAATPKN